MPQITFTTDEAAATRFGTEEELDDAICSAMELLDLENGDDFGLSGPDGSVAVAHMSRRNGPRWLVVG